MEADIDSVNNEEYAGITINYFPKQFESKQSNAFTFVISSPDGLLTEYGFNLSVPGNFTHRNGANANGETFSITTYFSASSVLDTANLTYWYDTTTGGYEEFTMNFNIIGDIGNNTIIANQDRTYGLGYFERSLVGVGATILGSGPVFMIAGALAGGFTAIFILGYLTFIGFMPFWVTIGSIIVGFVIVAWRSSQ
jgi:hypothetical protein